MRRALEALHLQAVSVGTCEAAPVRTYEIRPCADCPDDDGGCIKFQLVYQDPGPVLPFPKLHTLVVVHSGGAFS